MTTIKAKMNLALALLELKEQVHEAVLEHKDPVMNHLCDMINIVHEEIQQEYFNATEALEYLKEFGKNLFIIEFAKQNQNDSFFVRDHLTLMAFEIAELNNNLKPQQDSYRFTIDVWQEAIEKYAKLRIRMEQHQYND